MLYSECYSVVETSRRVTRSESESLFFSQTTFKNYKKTCFLSVKMLIFYNDLHALILDHEMAFVSMVERWNEKYLKTITRNRKT